MIKLWSEGSKGDIQDGRLGNIFTFDWLDSEAGANGFSFPFVLSSVGHLWRMDSSCNMGMIPTPGAERSILVIAWLFPPPKNTSILETDIMVWPHFKVCVPVCLATEYSFTFESAPK